RSAKTYALPPTTANVPNPSPIGTFHSTFGADDQAFSGSTEIPSWVGPRNSFQSAARVALPPRLNEPATNPPPMTRRAREDRMSDLFAVDQTATGNPGASRARPGAAARSRLE